MYGNAANTYHEFICRQQSSPSIRRPDVLLRLGGETAGATSLPESRRLSLLLLHYEALTANCRTRFVSLHSRTPETSSITAGKQYLAEAGVCESIIAIRCDLFVFMRQASPQKSSSPIDDEQKKENLRAEVAIFE